MKQLLLIFIISFFVNSVYSAVSIANYKTVDELLKKTIENSHLVVKGKIIRELRDSNKYTLYKNPIEKSMTKINHRVDVKVQQVYSSNYNIKKEEFFLNNFFYSREVFPFADSINRKINPILSKDSTYIFLLQINPQASFEQKEYIFDIKRAFSKVFSKEIQKKCVRKEFISVDRFKPVFLDKRIRRDDFDSINVFKAMNLDNFKKVNNIRDSIHRGGFDEKYDSLIKIKHFDKGYYLVVNNRNEDTLKTSIKEDEGYKKKLRNKYIFGGLAVLILLAFWLFSRGRKEG